MWEVLAKLLTETIPLETRTRIVACSAFLGLIFFMLWTTGALPFFAGFAPAPRLPARTAAIIAAGGTDRVKTFSALT